MRVRGLATAYEAGVPGDISKVLLVAIVPRRRNREPALVVSGGLVTIRTSFALKSPPRAAMGGSARIAANGGLTGRRQRGQPLLKRIFQQLRIARGQPVFGGKAVSCRIEIGKNIKISQNNPQVGLWRKSARIINPGFDVTSSPSKEEQLLGTVRLCGARSLGEAQMSARETKKQHTEEKAAYKATPAERIAVDKHFARREAKPQVRLKISKNGSDPQIELDHPDKTVGWALVMEALASADWDFLHGILSQLANASGQGQRT